MRESNGEASFGGRLPGRQVGFDGFEFDRVGRVLTFDGVTVHLGSRALDILGVLLERPGEVVSNRDLVDRVWPGIHVGESNLRVHVTELRKALGRHADSARFIKNVPGRGYVFTGTTRSGTPFSPGATGLASAGTIHGRSTIIADIAGQLSPGSMVTVVGIGGMGKTTVAREIVTGNATGLSEATWVDLAAARSRDAAVAALAAALGLTPSSSDPLAEMVAWMADRTGLLVLDCCEPVSRAARAIADSILSGAPGFAILATSREILGARGELVVELPPLAMPSDNTDLSAQAAASFPAVEMFLERGAAAGGVISADTSIPSVVSICSRLDGIPLAIEIAASHLAMFGLLDLEAALAARIRLGPSLKPGVEPRHSTLAGMLSWSYELLSEPEKRLLERLSVFEGIASLEAIRCVVPDADVPESDLLVLLIALGRKSLIKIERAGDRNGFRLLDTTRDFAADMLRLRGDERAFRARHAGYMLDCASSSRIEGETPLADRWFGAHTPNLPNLRAALAWCFAGDGDPPLVLGLATAAVPLMMQLSLLAESERWATAGLDYISGTPTAFAAERVRLLAYRGAAMLGSRGPIEISRAAMDEALAAAEASGDAACARLARSAIFWLLIYQGRPSAAIAVAEQIADASPDESTERVARNNVASASTFLGNQLEAHRLLADMERQQPFVELGRFMRIGSNPGIFSQVFMVKTLWMLARPDEAARLFERIRPELSLPQHGLYLCFCLNEVVIPMLCQQQRWEDARATVTELLDASARQGMAIRRDAAESASLAIEILSGDARVVAAYRHSLRALRDANLFCLMPWLDWVLAVGLDRSGKPAEALDVLEAAISAANASDNRWWLPELLRTLGEVTVTLGGGDDAGMSALRAARSLAHQQGALLLELRAATACARWGVTPRAESLDWLKTTLDRRGAAVDDPDAVAASALMKELSTATLPPAG